MLQSFVTLGHAFEQYTVNYMANLCSHFREQKSWSFTQVNFEILASAADALLLYIFAALSLCLSVCPILAMVPKM